MFKIAVIALFVLAGVAADAPSGDSEQGADAYESSVSKVNRREQPCMFILLMLCHKFPRVRLLARARWLVLPRIQLLNLWLSRSRSLPEGMGFVEQPL